jgi:hypothetical protein
MTHPNNKKSLENLYKWSKIARLALWDYWIIYRGAGPATSISAMPVNFRIYQKNKVESFLAECEDPIETSFYSLRLWLGYQLMRNPDQGANTLIDKFLNAYYGPAAPFMRQYLDYLETRMAEIKSPLGDVPVQQQVCLDNSFFIRSEELFTSAEKSVAGNTQILVRIAKERIAVDFARLERSRERKSGLSPNRQEVILRYKKNSFAAIEKFISPETQARTKQDIEQKCQKYAGERFAADGN